MALGKYSRVDNGRPRASLNYCSTATVVVFVALCLVGIWMMTSSSVVPVQTVDDDAQQSKNNAKDQLPQRTSDEKSFEATAQSKGPQFEDNRADLPEDAAKGDSNVKPDKNDNDDASNAEENQLNSEEKVEGKSNGQIKSNDGLETKVQRGESKSNDEETQTDGKSDTESGETIAGDGGKSGAADSDGNGNNSDSDDDGINSNSNSGTGEEKSDESIAESDSGKIEGQTSETRPTKDNAETNNKGSSEVFPSGAQSELLNENAAQNGSFSTQAAESKNEKEAQLSSNQQTEYRWKLCNTTAGPDYIPCLDNLQAIKSLPSTKHYEHRERHCPEQPPTCLVPLPQGYKFRIKWPESREKIWYNNVPHTKLAQFKGHQNWVKVSGEYLTFPGGGTQFKYGAVHYIDFIQESVAEIAWGKRSRVVLDVGCGVASFGGFLFDKDVLTMSFAPKDEHEAQVQFALERGIPAISAVMGTQRLPFPSRVFDVVHCARCRVPWHIEGGKLLLELNRVLRPGGFFVWSATPIYQKRPEDVEIWRAMQQLTKTMCWELVNKTKDVVNGVGIATFRKPTSNDCYEKRSQQEPPLCSQSDDPNAAWNVPLQSCMHKVPTDAAERGSQWPELWPVRVEKPPYWLSSSKVGVYGKAAPEDFTADYDHWKRVVTKSYLKGMGIDWSSVRNVMDMRAVYGGFAAALRDLNVWVMNIVTIDSPDTLPIIYERGLFGIYHDWCESFSTYPRSYDLVHADHLFSKVKERCNLVGVVAEVDRMVRPEGKLIVRDDVETINQLESMLRSMQWEVRMTFSKDKEGLLCVQKSMWRPKEDDKLTYALA